MCVIFFVCDTKEYSWAVRQYVEQEKLRIYTMILLPSY